MTSDMIPTVAALREFALAFPGAHEDFPWGERVIKVAKKVFVFLGCDDAVKQAASPSKSEHVGKPGGVTVGVKLPHSCGEVLTLPFAQPTHYGLGKHGWVTLTFAPRERVPLDLLKLWIEESYRAVAPKKLAAMRAAAVTPPSKPVRKAMKRRG